MPIFEYYCEKCTQKFEVIAKAQGAAECPRCGRATSERLLSSFAVSTSAGSGSIESSKAWGGPCGTCGDPRGPGSCRNDD